jgi:hypothetical protein
MPMIAMMGAEAECFGVGFDFGLVVAVGIFGFLYFAFSMSAASSSGK